jgi:hypothetical protein
VQQVDENLAWDSARLLGAEARIALAEVPQIRRLRGIRQLHRRLGHGHRAGQPLGAFFGRPFLH